MEEFNSQLGTSKHVSSTLKVCVAMVGVTICLRQVLLGDSLYSFMYELKEE